MPGARERRVESKGKLVEIGQQVLWLDATLMSCVDPTFDQCGDAVDRGQEFVGLVSRPVHYLNDVPVSDCGRAVGVEPVGDHLSTGSDTGLQESRQGRCLRIDNDLHPDSAKRTLPHSFDRDGHHALPFSASLSSPASRPADKRFIDLDPPLEPILDPGSRRKPKSVQHGPRGLVTPKPQRVLQLQCGEAILRRRHPPGRLEPYRQRRARPGKQRPGRGRNPAPAAGTPPPAIHLPARRVHTERANELPLGPAQPVQIAQTRRVLTKSRQEISVSAWIIHFPHGHAVQTTYSGFTKWIALFGKTIWVHD